MYPSLDTPSSSFLVSLKRSTLSLRKQNKKHPLNRSAFTLIELLIVITIIGIMAAAIVLNFSGARERQQLSLLADKSLAMLQNAQTEVHAGKYDSASQQYFCEGAHFVQGGEPTAIRMPYAEGACDFSAASEEDFGLITAPAVVADITAGESSTDELYAVYAPPAATLQLYGGDEKTLSGDGLVTFTSGGGGETYTIGLKLSPLTGLSSLSLLP